MIGILTLLQHIENTSVLKNYSSFWQQLLIIFFFYNESRLLLVSAHYVVEIQHNNLKKYI